MSMRNQLGLSLVELMISITLGLLLMAGVVHMFVSSNAVFGTQQNLSRIQETGRLAMEFIGRDLRMASYSGCRNTVIEQGTSRIDDPLTASPTNVFGLTGLHRNFTEGLHGYYIAGNGTTDLPTGITADLGSTFTVAANSDVIVIRGGNERGMSVNSVNNATQVFGYTDQSLDSNGCVEGFCDNGIAVISNCRNGRVFKINASPSVSSNVVTLSHGDTWVVTPPSNDIFASGTITPVHTIVYFVATSTTPVGNTIPSLWQKIDDAPAVEILQGVERIGIQYKIKPSASISNPPYESASTVDSWDAINTVEVEFIVRGDNPFELSTPQSYSFRPEPLSGTTTITPTDRFMRKSFKAIFSLRSRNP